jgi:hypothetical protein
VRDTSHRQELAQALYAPFSLQDIAVAIAGNEALQVPDTVPLNVQVRGALGPIGEIFALCFCGERFA